MEGCAVLRHLADKAAAAGHLDHAERLSVLHSLGHLGEPGRRAIHGIIGRSHNYDPAETSRQIDRLSGLPIGCTRMREKHATKELLPHCACEFKPVRQRGGYPTPLLHAIGFRRSWRDTLRGRRQAGAELRTQDSVGVTTVEEQESPRAPADAAVAENSAAEDPLAGFQVAGVPPHQWA